MRANSILDLTLLGFWRIEPWTRRFSEADAERAVLQFLRCAAEDDVPVGRVFLQLGTRDGFEVDHDGLEHVSLFAGALHEPVALIGGVAFDQQLRGKKPVTGFADCEVNMRTAEGPL